MNSTLKAELAKLNLAHLDIERVLRAALTRGGALAELFFEDTASTRVSYEGGKIDKIIEGTDRGVGLRIIFDNREVYGYSTDLTQDAVMALAQTLSAAVHAKDAKPWSKAID